MCAAPDYNGGDDKSPPRAGITAPCHSFNGDTLSGKVAKFRLSLSPLGPLELSKDKFLSAAPVALSEIPLWPYLLWCRRGVLHLFNSGGLIKVRWGRSLLSHIYKCRLKENTVWRAFKQVTFGVKYLLLLLLLLLRHLYAAVKVSAFAADLPVVVPQLLHVLQRGYANLLIRQLLTLKVGRRGGGGGWWRGSLGNWGEYKRKRRRERPKGKVLASTTKSLPELSTGWNYRRGVQSCLELLLRIFNLKKKKNLKKWTEKKHSHSQG